MRAGIRLTSIFMSAVLLLSGCSVFSKEEEPAEPTETPRAVYNTPRPTAAPVPGPEYVGGKLVVNFAGSGDGTGATQKLIDAYNATSDSVHIRFNELPADFSKRYKDLKAYLAAGKVEFDILETDITFVAEFADKGYILRLDSYTENDRTPLESYLPAAINASNYNGSRWGMPICVSANVLYVRQDLTHAVPKTWDDLISYASALNGTYNIKYGLVTACQRSESLVSLGMEFIRSYGGDIFDADGNIAVNSNDAVKGLEKFREIYKSAYVPTDIHKLPSGDAASAFIMGDSIYMIGEQYVWALGNVVKSKIKGRFSIARLPGGEAGSRPVLDATVLMINANSRYPDEAWDFIKFAAGEEGQRVLSATGGYVPALTDTMNDPAVLAANPHFSSPVFQEIILSAEPKPVLPYYSELSDIIQDELYRIFSTSQTGRNAAESIETRMKAAIGNK